MPIPGKPTQDFVPIKDIRNGVIVLNNGDLRMILMTSSLNFGLKSAEEQAAIIIQFQNVLNSLEFPVQISIQSKRLDIRPYLNILRLFETSRIERILCPKTSLLWSLTQEGARCPRNLHLEASRVCLEAEKPRRR
jgi:hypothetical protein